MTARDKILGIETNMKKVMVGCDEVIRLVMTALRLALGELRNRMEIL